jgi:hypothetical protein
MKSFVPLLLVVVALAAGQDIDVEGEGVLIGNLSMRNHGVKGQVYALDEKTILLKNFEYDGQGPDAFFWVGTTKSPGSVGTILPYPFDGKFFAYDDETAPVLKGRFDGSKDIKLTLPEDVKVTDLKWFSVWCRQFAVNFGDLIFPENFTLDKSAVPSTTSTTDLPPPLVHPSNDLDEEEPRPTWEDPDVKPEPDHHGKSRAGSASNVVASSAAIIVSYVFAKFLL